MTFEDIQNCPDRKHIKYVLLPRMIEQYHAASGKSWEQSALDIYEQHLQHTEKLCKAEAEKGRFRATFDGCTSEQTFLTESSNCYRRKEVGLPASRKVTIKKGNEILTEYYLHGSPVPYEEENFVARLTKTIRNFEQIPGENPIGEIRLLSPLNGAMSLFASLFSKKHRTDLDDYAQLLETAIAAELCKREIILLNFGVNQGRFFPADLQEQLNILGLSKLFEKIANPEIAPPARLITETDFNTLSEKELRKKYLTNLSNRIPVKSYDELQQFDDADTETKKLYNEIIDLLTANRWRFTAHNYQIQAKILALYQAMGYQPCGGCNDGKDRASRLSITVEANARKAAGDTRDISVIQKRVYDHSPHCKVAEMISMPGAKGLDIGDEDGNEHFNNDRHDAGRLKKIYTKNFFDRYKRKDKWKNFNLGRTFLSVTLWIVASIATLCASASLADTKENVSVVSNTQQTTIVIGTSTTPGKEESTSTQQPVREENVSTTTNPPPAQTTAEPMPIDDNAEAWREEKSKPRKISTARTLGEIRSRENSISSGSSPTCTPLSESFDRGMSRSMSEIFSF